MAGSLLIAALGCLLLARVGGTGGLPLLVLGFLLACVGVAPPSALATDLIVGSAPPERAGSAASISETGNELGVAFGLAALGSLGTVVYRSKLVVPAAVPFDLHDAAQESIAGATTVAWHLPEGLAAQLLDAARAAFTSGLNTVGMVGVVVFLILALGAVRALRQVSADATAVTHGGQETAQ